MGGTRGKRVPGKKKPKSVKAKVTSKMSSKRRLSRMGKELKKGQKGIVANYMTRSQVLRRLQITLRDFRYVSIVFLTRMKNLFIEHRFTRIRLCESCNIVGRNNLIILPPSFLLDCLEPFLQSPLHLEGDLPPGPEEAGLREGQGILPHQRRGILVP